MFIDIDELELEPEPPPRRFRLWPAFLAFFVTLAVLLVWLARAPGTDSLASPEVLADNFERMALRGAGLRTWEMPLRIALTGKGSEQYTPQVAEAAARFTMLTGIDAQLAPQGAESFNVLIELVPPREYGLMAARLGATQEGADYLPARLSVIGFLGRHLLGESTLGRTPKDLRGPRQS